MPSAASIDYWILAFSAITVFVTIWMGFRSAKSSKSASDFFVAGRSVSVGWNASAISGEYLSAASFMGVAGMVMLSGYDALWYPVCYACGYLFLLLFIAGPLRRFGAYTIPDFANLLITLAIRDDDLRNVLRSVEELPDSGKQSPRLLIGSPVRNERCVCFFVAQRPP